MQKHRPDLTYDFILNSADDLTDYRDSADFKRFKSDVLATITNSKSATFRALRASKSLLWVLSNRKRGDWLNEALWALENDGSITPTGSITITRFIAGGKEIEKLKTPSKDSLVSGLFTKKDAAAVYHH